MNAERFLVETFDLQEAESRFFVHVVHAGIFPSAADCPVRKEIA